MGLEGQTLTLRTQTDTATVSVRETAHLTPSQPSARAMHPLLRRRLTRCRATGRAAHRLTFGMRSLAVLRLRQAMGAMTFANANVTVTATATATEARCLFRASGSAQLRAHLRSRCHQPSSQQIFSSKGSPRNRSSSSRLTLSPRRREPLRRLLGAARRRQSPLLRLAALRRRTSSRSSTQLRRE